MWWLVENGYIQDGLKAVIYLVPLIFLIAARKYLNLKYVWLFFIGLSLLFFGSFLDFLDEFEFLKARFASDMHHNLQDFFEDTIGCTLGFAILLLALYLEYIKCRNQPK